MSMDGYWDNAEGTHRILRLATSAQRPALRALLDLPPGYVLAEESITFFDPLDNQVSLRRKPLTANDFLRLLADEVVSHDEVLDLLIGHGAISPTVEGGIR